MFAFIRSDFGDLYGETSVYFTSRIRIYCGEIIRDFASSGYTSLILYDINFTLPVFEKFSLILDETLRIVVRHVCSVFAFFLHTNISPYYVLPLQFIQIFVNKLTLATELIDGGSANSLHFFHRNVTLYVKPSLLKRQNLGLASLNTGYRLENF